MDAGAIAKNFILGLHNAFIPQGLDLYNQRPIQTRGVGIYPRFCAHYFDLFLALSRVFQNGLLQWQNEMNSKVMFEYKLYKVVHLVDFMACYQQQSDCQCANRPTDRVPDAPLPG